MTDKQLYRLCKKYGARALRARWRFAGLLPEVYKQRLYERRGFHTIYEFAARLGGLSRDQVDNVVRLERRFEDKPVLREALVSGGVSANKLARVASIATAENQEELAEKAKLLSARALEVFVRDEKAALQQMHNARKNEEHNGFVKPKSEQKSLHVQTFPEPDGGLQPTPGEGFRLDEDVEVELLELQQKGININELLRKFLKNRKLELAREKEKLAATHGAATPLSGEWSEPYKTASTKPSRYIPVKIRRHLRKEHGTKCSIRNCARDARVIHHTQRFALARAHDPRYLAPLCKEHHQIAHMIDTRYQIRRWNLDKKSISDNMLSHSK